MIYALRICAGFTPHPPITLTCWNVNVKISLGDDLSIGFNDAHVAIMAINAKWRAFSPYGTAARNIKRPFGESKSE